jgi:photosystem II stability/assembly factor-like uncharacterized protein
MMKILILFVLIMHLNANAKEWNVVENLNHEPLRKIKFNDKGIGVALGPRNNYLYSTDAGLSWNRQYVGTNFPLSDIAFTPDGGILISGYAGTIVYFSKPGSKFEDRSIDPVFNLGKFTYVDKNKLLIMTQNEYIIRSTDIADKWQGIPIKEHPYLLSIVKVQDKLYLAAYNSEASAIYESIDEGENWKLINIFEGEQLWNIFYDGNRIWAAGEDGLLCYSTDNCLTWNWVNTQTNYSIYGFTSQNSNIWLYCMFNKERIILYSDDSGSTWTEFDRAKCDYSGQMFIYQNKLFVAEDYHGVIKWIDISKLNKR